MFCYTNISVKGQVKLSRVQQQKNMADIFSLSPESRTSLLNKPEEIIDNVIEAKATFFGILYTAKQFDNSN